MVKLSEEQVRGGGWLLVEEYATKFGLRVETVFDWVKSGFIPHGISHYRVMIPVVCGKRTKWRGRK